MNAVLTFDVSKSRSLKALARTYLRVIHSYDERFVTHCKTYSITSDEFPKQYSHEYGAIAGRCGEQYLRNRPKIYADHDTSSSVTHKITK